MASAVTLQDFLISIGIEYDKKADADFRNITKQTGNLVGGVAKVLGGAAVAAAAYSVAVGKSTVNLDNFAKANDLTIEQVESLRFAFQQMGLSGKSADKVLSNLAGKMAEAKTLGSPLFKTLGQIGLDPTSFETSFDLVEALAKKIPTLSKEWQRTVTNQLGGNDLLLVLRAGSDELQKNLELRKKIGFVSKEQVETSKEFNKEWVTFTTVLKQSTLPAVRGILTIITAMLKGVREITKFSKTAKTVAKQVTTQKDYVGDPFNPFSKRKEDGLTDNNRKSLMDKMFAYMGVFGQENKNTRKTSEELKANAKKQISPEDITIISGKPNAEDSVFNEMMRNLNTPAVSNQTNNSQSSNTINATINVTSSGGGGAEIGEQIKMALRDVVRNGIENQQRLVVA